MENVELECKESNFKQNCLSQLCKDLLDQFDSTKNELQTRFLAFEEHENEFGILQSQVEAKSSELCVIERRIEEKSKELEDLEGLFEEHNEELAVKEKQHADAEIRVGEKEREFDSIEKRIKQAKKKLNWFEISMEDKLKLDEAMETKLKRKEKELDQYSEDIQLKEGELSDILRSIKEQKNRFSLKEEKMKAAEREADTQMKLKEEELSSIQKLIGECKNRLSLKEEKMKAAEREADKQMKLKEEEFSSIQKLIGECKNRLSLKEEKMKAAERETEKQMKLKEEELSSIQKLIGECKNRLSLKGEKMKAAEREWDKQMKLKKEELSSIQKSIGECNKEIESREEVLREMDLKVKEFHLHKESMEEWSCKLDLKEKNFESKVEELTKKINECLTEVQLKEIHFNSLEKLIKEREKQFYSQEKSLEECSSRLEMKERELEQRVKELELIQVHVDSIQKSTEEHTQNVEYPPASMVTVPSSPSNLSNMNRGGRGLQLLMNEHLKRIDLLDTEMSAHLKASADPAELVLDAIQGFFPSNSTVDNTNFDFDLKVIRRSCVILLEQLKRLSPEITPWVREEAILLAADWKAKMTVVAENCMETLGFLWLLAAFELTSTYDARELQCLLAIVSPVHASVLSQALGITVIAPAGSSLSFPIKIEEQDSSTERNVATTSCPNIQPSATADAQNLQGCLNEYLRGIQSVQNEWFEALRVSRDPENLALTVMEKSLDEYWRKGGVGVTWMLKNISMLKELTKVLPPAGFDNRENAIKLAVQWAGKMKGNADNSLEIVCFLQFIATFGLLSTFNIDEIGNLLGMVSQSKTAVELLQRLGFADKIPDFIRYLIERKQLVAAVRFIWTFKLNDKFRPPALLLRQYVDDAMQSFWRIWQQKESPNEKEMVVDDQMADLRSVFQCIKEYNLELCGRLSKDIEIQVFTLGKLKETWRCPRSSNASNFEDLERRNKRSTSTSAPQFQPPEKRQAIVAARPHESPTFTSNSLQLSSSSQIYHNYADPRQYGTAANYLGITGNLGAMHSSSSSQVNYNHSPPPQFVMAHHESFANLGAMQSSPSFRVYGNYRNPAQIGPTANIHDIGANSSAIQNAGLYQPHHLIRPH